MISSPVETSLSGHGENDFGIRRSLIVRTGRIFDGQHIFDSSRFASPAARAEHQRAEGETGAIQQDMIFFIELLLFGSLFGDECHGRRQRAAAKIIDAAATLEPQPLFSSFFSETVTVKESLLELSASDLTVMVTLPALRNVTTPVSDTGREWSCRSIQNAMFLIVALSGLSLVGRVV